MKKKDLCIIEVLIREGNIELAREKLDVISPKSIDRDELYILSNLSRRAGDINRSLQVLKNHVYRANKFSMSATDKELLEYAIGLTQIGALTEAEFIFDQIIDLKCCPKSFFQKALLSMRKWDYNLAVKQLKKYLELESEPYNRLVGKINLSACYIALNISIGEQTLNQLISENALTKYPILKAISFELLAQVAYEKEIGNEARLLLNEAKNLVKSNNHPLHYSISKWQILNDFKNNPELLRENLLIHAENSYRAQEWEVARDCYFFAAKVTDQQHELKELYFGTPHSSYKARIKYLLKSNTFDTYLWVPGRNPDKALNNVVDLTGKSSKKLGLTESVHKLLLCLSLDFFRPSFVGAVHSYIYNGEVYDPVYSYQKILQLIFRARKWLSKLNLGLEINQVSGGYQISGDGSTGIMVSNELKNFKNAGIDISVIKKYFKDGCFSAKEAQELTGHSRSAMSRILIEACEKGFIEKTGAGRSTEYKISKPNFEFERKLG